jgi:SAM-dependent methyltransferase
MIVNLYDEKSVQYYDKLYSNVAEADAAADYIASLCPEGGSVLELGIGSGRLAIPLADRGLKVHGIDGSEAMLAELARRDQDKRITAELGDFSEYTTGRRHDVVAVVLNTFFVLVDRQEQLAALTLVRDQLAPGGKFVLEAFDPAPFHAMTEEKTSMRVLDDTSIMVESVVVLRDHQIMISNHAILDGGVPHTTRHIVRYAFPSELDLMSQIAGLRLVSRYDGWDEKPYSAQSHRHVSVYERADA